MPNWRTKGRYSWLVLYRTDTQDFIRTRMVRPDSALFFDETERRDLADGSQKPSRIRRGCAPEIMSWPDIDKLRQWQADGATIRALLVNTGKGLHMVWDQSVPVLLDALDAPKSHQGVRAVLHSDVYAAAIYHDISLMKGATYADQGGGVGVMDMVLPLPGLTVYGIDETGYDVVTIKAYGRGGAALATGTESKGTIPNTFTSLTLPSGTFRVELTGPYYSAGVKPILTTTEPVVGEYTGGYELGVESAENGYDYATLTEWGIGEATEYSETFAFGGTDYTVDLVELGPDGLADLLISDATDHTLAVDVITEDEP